MHVLVINSGSSSIKYRRYDMTTRTVLASGVVSRIGEATSRRTHRYLDATGDVQERVREGRVEDHREGLEEIVAAFAEAGPVTPPEAIGHRVVHGGVDFGEPTRIDPGVLQRIARLSPLAPLHNPACVTGIELALERYPDVPQVAVFDTTFHRSLPDYAYHYALPFELCRDHGIRRYGFHGISHAYVARAAARHLQSSLSALNLIILHLGNGSTATAVKAGVSVDTSMGMTPLEGLVMGSRSGDLDPAVVFYLARRTDLSFDAVESLLNSESGLKGICGVNDMREILRRAQGGDSRARLAIQIYTYRIRKYIGAYLAVLGSIDALVFTGGIGENAAEIRRLATADLEPFGVEIDRRANARTSSGVREIQTPGSRTRVLVVPTDEELEIAEQTVATLSPESRDP